jgi:hypothetical protein
VFVLVVAGLQYEDELVNTNGFVAAQILAQLCGRADATAQAGNNQHEHIMEALELFGDEVMPEFKERDEKLRAEKMARLAPLVDAALERRESGAPTMPADYRITALARNVVKKMGGDELLDQIAENSALGAGGLDALREESPDPQSLVRDGTKEP